MTDNASTYPTTIDPEPVTLEDGIDFIPADALDFLENQIAAVQGEIGNDAVDFSADGAPNFGTVAALIRVLYRMEVGSHTTASAQGGFRVNFSTDANGQTRFTIPPIVFLQQTRGSSADPGERAHSKVRRIGIDGFTISTGHATRSAGSSKTFWWAAIQPPFGYENAVQGTDD